MTELTDYEKLLILGKARWSLHVDGKMTMYDHYTDKWYTADNLNDAFAIHRKLTDMLDT